MSSSLPTAPPSGQQCLYNAQGEYACPVASVLPPGKEGFRPAWVSADAEKSAWAERSAGGVPVPATEWQSKVKESRGRMAPAQ